MWKGNHCGQDVAVKVLKTYQNSDSQKITGVGDRLCYHSTCQSADRIIEVLQGNRGVEIPPAPKCAAAARRDDRRDSACDGIRVDGAREHQ